MKLHLASGQDYLPGLWNVDWTDVYKVDQKANILQPEFWATVLPNVVDEVVCRHFVEHIPHELKHTDKDGLIWFMEQIYRVCEDNARVHIAFPHYQGSWAYGDPTHCRFLQGITFAYFDRVRAGKDMPDYGLNCDFSVEVSNKVCVLPGADTMDQAVLDERIKREWNTCYEEQLTLLAHKPMRRPLP